jgi:hypothetical protein
MLDGWAPRFVSGVVFLMVLWRALCGQEDGERWWNVIWGISRFLLGLMDCKYEFKGFNRNRQETTRGLADVGACKTHIQIPWISRGARWNGEMVKSQDINRIQ